jgi:hypothetical protein
MARAQNQVVIELKLLIFSNEKQPFCRMKAVLHLMGFRATDSIKCLSILLLVFIQRQCRRLGRVNTKSTKGSNRLSWDAFISD